MADTQVGHYDIVVGNARLLTYDSDILMGDNSKLVGGRKTRSPFFPVYKLVDFINRADNITDVDIVVGVAQLVRALGCGPGGRGFESHHPPFFRVGITNSVFRAVLIQP